MSSNWRNRPRPAEKFDTRYTLFVIELKKSGRVHLVGSTSHPDDAFVLPVARTLTGILLGPEVLICDQDIKRSLAECSDSTGCDRLQIRQELWGMAPAIRRSPYATRRTDRTEAVVIFKLRDVGGPG